jgi:Dolichyl-phosphate-mannose-protein mannosyltransferase
LKIDFSHYTSLIIIIPLVLSAFTHLWNPLGFPTLHVDEGHYMRRAIQVLKGLGPQEPTSEYDKAYDHPYFGQLFLAAAFKIIGYPDSLSPKVEDMHSVELLYLVPRVLMGLLSVVDTFLIYKIAERRYNQNVAFIAAILFAVMPLSWMTRGIFLDSILLPLFLTSLLFAIYAEGINEIDLAKRNKKKSLVILSGIFLGLAIFTKAPVFTMIPLIAFMILKNNNKKFKNLTMLWFTPVILIPLIWPVYAILTGHFDEWLTGVLYQIERESDKTLYHSITLIFKIDPVLLTFGTAGFVYTLLKRDYFLLLWIIPYLLFLYYSGWVTHFHWMLLIPALCIAAAILLQDSSNRIRSRKKVTQILGLGMISAFVFFGLYTTITLITLNLNSSYLEIYGFTVQELQDRSELTKENNETLTVIGGHRIKALMWIPQYVFDINVSFRDTDDPKDNFTIPVEKNEKLVLIVDPSLRSKLLQYVGGDEKYERIGKIYHDSDTIATFIDKEYGRYDFMNIEENHGLGRFVEVKAKY